MSPIEWQSGFAPIDGFETVLLDDPSAIRQTGFAPIDALRFVLIDESEILLLGDRVLH